MKFTRGFAPILLIGLFLSLGVFGFIFYKVYINPLKQQFKDEVIIPTPAGKTNISTESSKLAPSITPDPTANWKTYENKDLGVKIMYPNSWKTYQYGPDFFNYQTTNLPYYPNEGVMIYGDKQIWIYLFPNPSKLSLDDFIANQIKKQANYQGQGGIPYLLPKQSTKVLLPNRIEAFLGDYYCEPINCKVYIISREKAFYAIVFDESINKETLNKMLTTLTFLN